MHGSASWTLGTRTNFGTTEGWQSWVDVQDCQCCQLWLSRDAAEKPPRCNKNNLLGPSFTSTSLSSLFSLSLMKLWVPPKATPHLSNLSLKTTWPTWLSSLTPPSYLHWILSSPAPPPQEFLQRKATFTMRVVRSWHRWPGETVAIPSLDMFKANLDGLWSNLVWWKDHRTSPALPQPWSAQPWARPMSFPHPQGN